MLELSKVRRQVAVVQRAAAFLHGEPGGLFHIYAMMVAAHGGAPGGPTVAELRRAPTMRTHATCTSLNISKYVAHARSIQPSARKGEGKRRRRRRREEEKKKRRKKEKKEEEESLIF